VATGYGGAASTSWALAYNATAAQVKAALEALPNIGVGNVDVTGGALPGTALTITFRGTLTKRDVPNLIATSSLTGGATPAITITTVDGKAGTTSEVQTLTISGTPTGGTFTLRFGDVLGGVFRSTDGAATFTRVVAGAATDLVADPGKAGRLYAGIAESGVYRSDDAGVSWKRFDTGLTLANPLDQVDNDGNGILNDLGETGAGAARIRLAIQQNVAATDLAPNTVYAAIIASALMGIFYSTPILTGATAADWTQSAWALLGPVDAVAPAPVSGTLNKYATTASVTFAGATITRTTGDWRTDGFALGQAVTVAGATVPANNGSWRIADVTDTVLTLTGAAFGAAHANAVAFAATSTAAAIPGVTITSGLTTAGVLEWPPSNPKQQPQINLGEQGNLHVGFVADGKGNVFISGDISLSTAGYPAGLFLWNKAAGTWTQLVDQTTTTGIVRPHADVRALILDPDGAPGRNGANFGKLLMATDGGVWSLDLTTTPNRLFTSLNGGGTNGSGALRISEVLSAAYDELNALVFGGAQDNGSYEQLAVASDGLDSNANGLIDDLGERITWRSTSGGDGNTGLAIPLDTDGNVLYDHVLHIVGSNNLTYFTESLYAANGTRLSHGWPATFGSAGPNIAVTGLLLSGQYSGPTASLSNDEVFLLAGSNTPYYLELLGDVAGTSTFYLRQFSPTGPRQLATVAGATTLQKVTVLGGVSAADAAFTGFNYIPMAVNAVAPNQVVVGMTSLYESTNYLATISATPLNDRAWTALAYGGKIAGVADPTALYAAEGNNVWVRYAGHALAAEPLAGATSIRSVVLDPRDARVAYAATDTGIFKRDGTTGAWSPISQKLFNANFQSVEFVPGATAATDVLLVGTAVGIYRAFNPAADVAWTLYGRNLPNALVTGILDVAVNSSAGYSGANPLANNQLVVGTQGRGIWTIPGLSASIATEPVLKITGSDGVDDTVVISRNAVNASILDITMNGAKVFSTPVLSLKRIEFDGKGGDDSLTIDNTYGAISLPDGILFTGGAGIDALDVTGGRYDTAVETSVAAVGSSRDTIEIDVSRGGGHVKAVFTDFVALTDLGISNGMTASTAAEKLADGLARLRPVDERAELAARDSRRDATAGDQRGGAVDSDDAGRVRPDRRSRGRKRRRPADRGRRRGGPLAPLHLRQRRLAVLADRGR